MPPGTVRILIVLIWAASEPAPADVEEVLPQAQISIPAQLLSAAVATRPSTGSEVPRWVGDLRIGDLDGDGTVDFVAAKSACGAKISHLGAFTWQGRVLWEWGDRNRRVADNERRGEFRGAGPPWRPGPVLVVDIDGDRRIEVVAIVLREDVDRTNPWDMKDTEFVVLDGATGQVKRRAAPRALIEADARDASGQRQESNYVHQRLLAADLRGTGGPHDFVVKLGDTVLACDGTLNVLWTNRNRFSEYPRHAAYIPAVGDMDADGRDEVCGGQFLFDHDGRPLWEKMMAANNDSVAIVDWDGDPANGMEAVLSGFGQVVDAAGRTLLRLGESAVPHGQEVRCGRFRPDMPGVQMAVRCNGHETDILLADRSGKVQARFKVGPSPNNVGMETVRWRGETGPDLLYAAGALWDGHGRQAARLTGLPKPSGKGRTGFWHCVAADLESTGRESVVLFDPWQERIFVYGAEPLVKLPPTGYRHTAKQYNVRLMD